MRGLAGAAACIFRELWSQIDLVAKRLFVTVLLVSCFATTNAGAQVGGISVTPTRVILNDRDRSFQVTIVNRSTAEATYRVFFTQQRMNEQGRLEPIESHSTGLLLSLSG